MSNALPPGYAVPNTSLPKTTGTLNIIFAALLLLYGACQLSMTLAAPALLKLSSTVTKETMKKVQEQRDRQIADLKEQEEKAESDEEKAALKERREAIERQPVAGPPDMSEMMDTMRHPVIRAYTWGDLATMLALNVAMLASGVGLLRLSEGARKLALWVAGLKIARLVVLPICYIAAVLPIATRMQQDMMAKLTAQGGANAQAAKAASEMAKLGAAAGSAMVVVGAILGMIWPIAMIYLLTRPGSRAACLAASKPPATIEEAELS